MFIKLEDLCIKGIQWTCRCFVGKKAGTAYTGFTSTNTPGFGLRHHLWEQLLASPRGTPVTTRYKTSQHICKQVHQQNHPVVKEYWFWPGYEFMYISWDGMGVLTSRLGGRPMVRPITGEPNEEAGHLGGEMFTKPSGEWRMWVRMGRRPKGSIYRLGKLVGESLSR